MPKRRRTGSPNNPSSLSSPFSDTASPTDPDEPASKYVQTSSMARRPRVVMQCTLPPHSGFIQFYSFEEFEIHYAKFHKHRCLECQHNFPSDHFLSLHISENHDPLNEVRKARGEKTFHCLVEDCEKVYMKSHSRTMHLIDKHKFPKNYDFEVVNGGVDNKASLLQFPNEETSSEESRVPIDCSVQEDHGQESTHKPSRLAPSTEAQDDATSYSTDEVERKVEQVTSKMSSLRFVPQSVRFGRGGKRGGFSRS